MSMIEIVKFEFQEKLALLILHGKFTAESEYQKGWLDAFSHTYTMITGETRYQLINAANEMIAGSGKHLYQT